MKLKWIFALITLLIFPTNLVGQEPIYIKYLPIRNVTSGSKTLNDVESHIQAGNIYRDSDIVTSVHEQSHGISSLLRQKYSSQYPGCEALYVLQNRVVILRHPNIKISDVAPKVPRSIRFSRYNLYLQSQQRYWNNEPCYLLEEWNCYYLGAIAGNEYNLKDRTSDSTQGAIEFIGYSLCLLQTMKELDAKYNDRQLKAFVKWEIENVNRLAYKLHKNGTLWDKSYNWYSNIINNNDSKNLRSFCKNYFGEKWCKSTIGF